MCGIHCRTEGILLWLVEIPFFFFLYDYPSMWGDFPHPNNLQWSKGICTSDELRHAREDNCTQVSKKKREEIRADITYKYLSKYNIKNNIKKRSP